MGWISRHWVALISAVPFAVPVLKSAGWLISRAGDADFIISRSADPGWVGAMINWVIDPPGWAMIPLIIAGLLLIYWDVRRNRNARAPVQDRSLPVQAAAARKSQPANSVPTYTRSKGQIRHNIHTQGGALSVGRKEREFALHFSVANRDRARMLKGGNLQYLARVRGKNKGDTLSIQEFPDAHGWFAIDVGERFLGVNEAGQIIQGFIVGVKDDRYDEYNEVIFKYRIVSPGQEIVAL